MIVLFLTLTVTTARLTNDEFNSQVDYRGPFGIDDTDQLKKLEGILTSLPELFGYSEQNGLQMFPPYFYPRCENQYREENSVKLNFSDNTLELNCSGEYNGSFILGPVNGVEVSNPTDAMKFWEVVEYEGHPMPINSTNEFVLATCDKDVSNGFDIHSLEPRFRNKRYKEALANRPKSTEKPMMILLVTVDSFSRRHFFRKLPTTVEYLNELNRDSKYAVFDFKLHNIIGADTSENMMRVFGTRWVKSFPGKQGIDFHGDDAIWSILKKHGFMTLYGSDACTHNVPKSLGKKPKVDHAVNMFYCANYIHGNYSASKYRASAQRCLGEHMSHWWLMEYSYKFSKLYSKANQWLFTHFTAAHEMTGQHAATLNSDLRDYIKRYLEEFRETHEVVVLLHGDHGMRYGKYRSATESIQEHRLPAFFMIASHELLSKIEYSYDTLWQNTMRLNTKPDLRETMLHLGAIASNGIYEKNQPGFYSLLTEVIPLNRTCEEAQIPLWYCSTYLPKPHLPRLYDPAERDSLDKGEAELAEFINQLAERVILTMNEDVFTTTIMEAGLLCHKLTIKAVKSVAYVEVNPSSQVLRILLSVNESVQAQFDSWIAITSHPLNEQNMQHQDYLAQPISYRGKRLYSRILTITRTDKYAGECELISRALQLNPQYCICKSEYTEFIKTVKLGWQSS
jgi:hypothetical protein